MDNNSTTCPPHGGPGSPGTIQLLYVGPSMNPTLRSHELLRVEPYRDRPIEPGDVVVFKTGASSVPVVHRVVAVSANGLKVRGDNNEADDSRTVKPSQVIGRVTHAHGAHRTRIVRGGPTGASAAAVARVRGILRRTWLRLLVPAYDWFARSGIFRLGQPSILRTRIARFGREGHYDYRLLWGKRFIGRLRQGETRWMVTPPWRLFIDPLALPIPDNCQRTQCNKLRDSRPA